VKGQQQHHNQNPVPPFPPPPANLPIQDNPFSYPVTAIPSHIPSFNPNIEQQLGALHAQAGVHPIIPPRH